MRLSNNKKVDTLTTKLKQKLQYKYIKKYKKKFKMIKQQIIILFVISEKIINKVESIEELQKTVKICKRAK